VQERLFAHWDGPLYEWWQDDAAVKRLPPDLE
jgi:hypothetical protein